MRSRLASTIWILGAIVAGFLGAFLAGFSETPGDAEWGLLVVGGAIVAAGTGIGGWVRPSRLLSRWSVSLGLIWVVATALLVPDFRFSSDSIVFGWLPALFPVLAALRSLAEEVRRRTA